MSASLPKGWAITELQSIARINPKHPKGLSDSLPVSFTPMAAIRERSPQFEFIEERPIGKVRKGFTHFADGDVLFAKITPCMENGKGAVASNLLNGLGCGSTELHVLRPLSGINPYYLYYYLGQPSIRQSAKENFTGSAGQARVPTSFIEHLTIPIAPTSEQHRIVAQVETLLNKVQTCQDRLDRVPTILRRFRQAVLTAAASGRLTADWRQSNPDVEPASLYIERIRQEREQERMQPAGKGSSVGVRSEDEAGVPWGWCTATIGEISECLDRLRVPVNRTERAARQGNIPYYGANGQVGWIDEYLFDEDLVLVVEDETFIGREKPFSYVIRGKTWVNNHAHVLRPLGGLTAEYMNIVLSYYDFTPLTSGTTGRRKLTQEGLVTARLEVAPLVEQREIVNRVNALFQFADRVEERYGKARTNVDRLTQSILAKAFTGQLVPTDAELAQAEGRGFETAADLLARVRLYTLSSSSNGSNGTRTPRGTRNNGRALISR